MSETPEKRVDESWKEQAAREKQAPAATSKPQEPMPSPAVETAPEAREHEPLEARFDVFVSGLVMEALIAMGDMPHPATRKQAANLPQAKYLIDLLGVLEEKTKGNLSIDEGRLLNDALYQLRMRYLSKSGGVTPA